MNKHIIIILANMISLYIGTILFTKVVISSVSVILIAGIGLWIVNLIVRPLLLIITIPVNVLTLGLFSLVINTWMVMLVGKFVNGLWIGGFWTAFGLALVVSAVNSVLGKILRDK